MINYEDHPDNIREVITVTQFRRWMAHYIAMVRYGDDWVCIKRRGMDPVYLVSKADMELIREKSDDIELGPRNPKTGSRTGRGFMYWVRRLLKAERSGDPAKLRAVEIDLELAGYGDRPEK
ncbi:MAG: type II toxin-antitoxin system prevent-host-death family antitoxin [Silicimonas sp.]|nr:type II toxin-antitoxin system prevent-host-death family antitoxin [Silicimonas sp.]